MLEIMLIGNKDFMNEVLILQKDMHIARKNMLEGIMCHFLRKHVLKVSGLDQNFVITTWKREWRNRALYSPSPVIESRKSIWVKRKFLFHFLRWPCKFQKNFDANHKMVNKPQNPWFSKWRKITMAPIFICGIKIQMPAIYISLERKFYQD